MNSKMFSKILLLAFFSLLRNTFAQETKELFSLTIEELMNVKVKVSSVIAEDIFNTTSTVTVIDENLIKEYNFLSIAEALESIAGIDMYQTIIDRNVTTFRGVLQNFYANKILLMINNIPTWQPIYGEGYIDRIDINDVKRIEVLKGPASVIYGSNAYTGVINIILNDKEKNGINAHVRAGYPNTFNSGLNINYLNGDFRVFSSLNTSHVHRKPYEVEVAKGFEYNGYSKYNYENDEEKNNLNVELIYKKYTLYFNTFY